MDQDKLAELQESVTAAEQAAADAGGIDEDLNKEVIKAKAALEAAKAPPQVEKRTEKEKAVFTLKGTAQRLKDLGEDPLKILGIQPETKVSSELSDDTPLTVGALRELQRQDTKRSALQMANDISDEAERDEVISILNRLEPSGDAQSDFNLAQNAANAQRAKRIADEQARRTQPRRTAAGGSSPAPVETEFTPTAEEMVFMRPPYNLSKDKIIARRKAEQERLGTI